RIEFVSRRVPRTKRLMCEFELQFGHPELPYRSDAGGAEFLFPGIAPKIVYVVASTACAPAGHNPLNQETCGLSGAKLLHKIEGLLGCRWLGIVDGWCGASGRSWRPRLLRRRPCFRRGETAGGNTDQEQR